MELFVISLVVINIIVIIVFGVSYVHVINPIDKVSAAAEIEAKKKEKEAAAADIEAKKKEKEAAAARLEADNKEVEVASARLEVKIKKNEVTDAEKIYMKYVEKEKISNTKLRELNDILEKLDNELYQAAEEVAKALSYLDSIPISIFLMEKRKKAEADVVEKKNLLEFNKIETTIKKTEKIATSKELEDANIFSRGTLVELNKRINELQVLIEVENKKSKEAESFLKISEQKSSEAAAARAVAKKKADEAAVAVASAKRISYGVY